MSASRWLYRSCALAAAVVIALGLWQMRLLPSMPADRSLPQGLHTPILALELSCNDRDLGWIEGPQALQGIRSSIRIDDWFLVSYAVLFLACGALLWHRRLWLAAGFVVVSGPAAAVFDYMENQAMRAVLDHESACPEHASLIKWGLLFAALLGVAAVYIDLEGSAVRLALGLLTAFVTVITSLEGILGVLMRSPLLIEAASMRLPTALVLAFIFFSMHHALRDGVGPWLDRLTEATILGRRPLELLSRWPQDPMENG